MKRDVKNMDRKILALEIQKMNEAGEIFLKQYEDVLGELFRKTELTDEESLEREILLELTEHIYGIRHIADYLNKGGCRIGTVQKNADGEIVFNGEVLPIMTELEVYVKDEFTNRDVWTRVFVGGIEQKYLVGLKKNAEINRIPARIRE